MPEQEQGRQFGGVPDDAGRKASAASAHDTRLAGPRPRAAAFTPEQAAFQTPRPIGAQGESDGTGPALAPLILRPRSDAARVLSGEARIGESDGGVRPFRIDTPRGSFAALCAGPRTSARPTVVCVHGFMGCKQDFAELLPLVAAGYRVVAYDQRGHFETAQMRGTEAEEDVRLPELAKDVLAIIDALGCERVHLVGHSFGGFVVRAAALADARRITTLTLISSGQGAVGKPHAEELRLLSWALREYPLDQVWEAMKAYRAQQQSGQRRLVDPERESFLRRQFITHSPHALLEAARALQEEPNRLDELHRLDRPMLVLYGENETYWPASAQRHMAERLKARLVEIPHAGHCPPIDKPLCTAVELRAFFTAVDGLAPPAPPAARVLPAALL